MPLNLGPHLVKLRIPELTITNLKLQENDVLFLF